MTKTKQSRVGPARSSRRPTGSRASQRQRQGGDVEQGASTSTVHAADDAGDVDDTPLDLGSWTKYISYEEGSAAQDRLGNKCCSFAVLKYDAIVLAKTLKTFATIAAVMFVTVELLMSFDQSAQPIETHFYRWSNGTQHADWCEGDGALDDGQQRFVLAYGDRSVLDTPSVSFAVNFTVADEGVLDDTACLPVCENYKTKAPLGSGFKTLLLLSLLEMLLLVLFLLAEVLVYCCMCCDSVTTADNVSENCVPEAFTSIAALGPSRQGDIDDVLVRLAPVFHESRWRENDAAAARSRGTVSRSYYACTVVLFMALSFVAILGLGTPSLMAATEPSLLFSDVFRIQVCSGLARVGSCDCRWDSLYQLKPKSAPSVDDLLTNATDALNRRDSAQLTGLAAALFGDSAALIGLIQMGAVALVLVVMLLVQVVRSVAEKGMLLLFLPFDNMRGMLLHRRPDIAMRVLFKHARRSAVFSTGSVAPGPAPNFRHMDVAATGRIDEKFRRATSVLKAIAEWHKRHYCGDADDLHRGAPLVAARAVLELARPLCDDGPELLCDEWQRLDKIVKWESDTPTREEDNAFVRRHGHGVLANLDKEVSKIARYYPSVEQSCGWWCGRT